MEGKPAPKVEMDYLDLSDRGHKGCVAVSSPPLAECSRADTQSTVHRLGVTAKFTLYEGQSVTFVLREPPKAKSGSTSGGGPCDPSECCSSSPTLLIQETELSGDAAAVPDCSEEGSGETQAVSFEDPHLSQALIERLFHDTTAYWLSWLQRCTYKGRWRETVQRAALCLKLLTFAPTGAIVAAPTFSLPEDLNGAGRNWDYR